MVKVGRAGKGDILIKEILDVNYFKPNSATEKNGFKVDLEMLHILVT